MIRVSPRAASTGESGIGLLAGESLPLADLVKAAMIKSANDACVAIAEGVAGSEAAFVKMMNEKAAELGCRNTHFMNPHGLHHPSHYTTAHDLAVIGRAALKYPFLDEISKEKTAVIPGNWKVGNTRLLINRNKLLWRWNECDGLKTGYTRQAGNCLVATASRSDSAGGKAWRLLSVVMKVPGGASWPESHTLLQKGGFDVFRREPVARLGENMGDHAVRGGAFHLEAVAGRDFVLPLRGEERATLQKKVEIFNEPAPVARGQVVGHVEYYVGKGATARRIADLPLVARSDVPQTLLARTFPHLGNRFTPWPLWKRILVFGLTVFGFAAILTYIKVNSPARRKKRSVFHAAGMGKEPSGHRRDDSRYINSLSEKGVGVGERREQEHQSLRPGSESEVHEWEERFRASLGGTVGTRERHAGRRDTVTGGRRGRSSSR